MSILSRIFGRTSALDLESAAVSRDPYPHYEALRRRGPVVFLPHHAAWIVLGYDELQAALTQPALFSSRAYGTIDPQLLGADPPEHTAVRRIVTRYFAAEALERVAAFAEERAAELVTPRLDVVGGYARPLTQEAAAHFLGFDEVALAEIRRSYDAARDFAGYAHAVRGLADRSPMYQHLLGDGLDADGARSVVALLWFASTKSVERTIAHGVRLLLFHHDVRAALVRDPSRGPAFVEELLRLHTPELVIRRATTAAARLGGADLPAHANVFLCIAAANRDPAKFDDPAELRLGRGGPRPLSFGSGIHHCVGATLGRRLVELALRTLLERAPGLRAAQPLETIRYAPSYTAHEMDRLVVETEAS